jgi:hypothetical protein
MATGRIIEPTLKGKASSVELPKYDPETETITWEGKQVKAPSGTKYETDDGQVFILRHARTVQGGWHKVRKAEPKGTAKAKK